MDLGLADPVLGFSEHSYLPRSNLYNHSCNRFSKPLLTSSECTEDIIAARKQREHLALQHIIKCQHSSDCNFRNPIARWDTKFETGAKTALLHPFSPILVAADEIECIRIWNYEEATLQNSFSNHEYPYKGISKLCLVNEVDESLLLVASSDGNVRIWKNYICQGKQTLVTAFSAIHDHRPGARSASAVVDWQQCSGYMYASGEISSTMVWDLNKEQLLSCIPLTSDCSTSALAASQVYGGQYAAGFVNGSIRLFDIRTPNGLVFVSQPHTPGVDISDGKERVVGISFQPGLDPVKIVSASKAGNIKFLDIRKQSDAYLTVDAHRGSLTALAVHRHAPLIASGSATQVIKVFNLEGAPLGTISPTFMAQKTGPVSCLAFHPYQILLAAGDTGARVSIYADKISPPR